MLQELCNSPSSTWPHGVGLWLPSFVQMHYINPFQMLGSGNAVTCGPPSPVLLPVAERVMKAPLKMAYQPTVSQLPGQAVRAPAIYWPAYLWFQQKQNCFVLFWSSAAVGVQGSFFSLLSLSLSPSLSLLFLYLHLLSSYPQLQQVIFFWASIAGVTLVIYTSRPEYKCCIANVKHDIPASFSTVIELPFIVLKTEQSCLLFQISSIEKGVEKIPAGDKTDYKRYQIHADNYGGNVNGTEAVGEDKRPLQQQMQIVR